MYILEKYGSMNNKEEYFRFPTQALETADMDPGRKKIKKLTRQSCYSLRIGQMWFPL
jgi:hypothetical protein